MSGLREKKGRRTDLGECRADRGSTGPKRGDTTDQYGLTISNSLEGEGRGKGELIAQPRF